MEKKQLEKKIRNFRDQLKKYRDLSFEVFRCQQNGDDAKDLYAKWGILRETLLEEWGRIEKSFQNMGVKMVTRHAASGTTSYIFDEALGSQILDPYMADIVAESLDRAIEASSMAIGIVDSLDSEQIKQLDSGGRTMFISYHYDKEERNKELIQFLRDELLSAYPLFFTTGERPTKTGIEKGVPEKVRQLIEGADYTFFLLTKDKEQKDGQWTPSKWVLDEVAHARAKGKMTILFLEEGAIFEKGIIGDIEYISFLREDMVKAVAKLVQLLNSILR